MSYEESNLCASLRTPEILAPVGGEEQLIAAVRCGADAVYLGTKAFNARRNASNFDFEALKETVSYCHARDARVHVTLNTLIKDAEWDALCTTVRGIAAAGADAVIVQDLAVAAMVKRICPSLKMHASTQMAIHNADGARMAEELGFSRVVLARELSLKETENICAASPIETEVFVHGALCMSVSGCCELSCLLGGRSGNRGLCAQPCRLNFQSRGRDYALSLKDLCAVPLIGQLRDCGVASLKIEGRMKRPEYVAAAVTACVDARAGRQPDLETLRSVFSRGGFTDGYLTGRRDGSMFGIRTQEDADKSAAVLGSLRGLYRLERPSVPVDMTVSFQTPKPLLTVSDGTRTVTVAAEEEVTPGQIPSEGTKERVKAAVTKTGGTPFQPRAVAFEGEPLYMPASVWNGMRRRGLEKLLGERSACTPLPVTEAESPRLPPHIAANPREIRLRFHRPEQVAHGEKASFIILPMEAIDENVLERYGDKVMAELPRVLFPTYEKQVETLCASLREKGLQHIYAENLYGFALARRWGFTLHGGCGLNALNGLSLERYRQLGAADMTVSFEASAKDMQRLGGTCPRGALVYGNLPLMVFRACPNQTEKGCLGCDGVNTLRDRKGVTFPVLCGSKRYSVMYNSVPLALDRGTLKNLDFETLYFTTETRREAEEIIENYLNGVPYSGPHTRGMYYRDLL